MRLYTNVSSMIAYENYSRNSKLLSESLKRLSTGLRINSASDDPSGLAIADKLRTQASSVQQSIENANSAIAMTQIADKAMAEQSNILDIVKVKLLQASTDTTTDEGREAIRKDITKLLSQLNNIASQTNYNGNYILQKDQNDTAISDDSTFQIGEKALNTIDLKGIQANTVGLGLDALKNLGANSLSKTEAQNWLDNIDNSLTTLNTFRAEVGSTQNQLESSVRYMMTLKTNLKASESVIRDVDYAKEVAHFSKLKILVQAGIFAMAQANKIQEAMLRYLFR
ncbi:flagellin [Malaciobacter halophilus]|uniref:Flagellin n=1 Tax=Malaciobacter halophilus TaxID=197482 RepID=A0A2N1J016_9BACT|nr:flagellin [Malaciobacter halophilus]AXH10459.1 flagellin [Malaciobacter halophilus]PKI79891.1 flagellin [Malaciobacter halophilus]